VQRVGVFDVIDEVVLLDNYTWVDEYLEASNVGLLLNNGLAARVSEGGGEHFEMDSFVGRAGPKPQEFWRVKAMLLTPHDNAIMCGYNGYTTVTTAHTIRQYFYRYGPCHAHWQASWPWPMPGLRGRQKMFPK
jgi:hypothetical protein